MSERKAFTEKQYRCRECGQLFKGKYAREVCPCCVMRAHSKKKVLKKRVAAEKRKLAAKQGDLNAVAKAAHAAHMTYGQYVASLTRPHQESEVG